MATPISDIRNLGPASAQAYIRAGIDSAETLREMGADAAYLRVIAAGTKAHFIGYYALVLGLQGRPWTDCSPDEKRALRRRFDALVAGIEPTGSAAQIEKILNDIGVRAVAQKTKAAPRRPLK